MDLFVYLIKKNNIQINGFPYLFHIHYNIFCISIILYFSYNYIMLVSGIYSCIATQASLYRDTSGFPY